ncbi:MerR family transcriptional regulator [Pseudoclavibacter sp. RFBJ3]|uniref:MerR family transcriptional regulator n=1 Tax=unclassified Pseudoclavibacter TaxID=2615177 RepID=UPI000CE837B3|nr:MULTISPECIES: MerR family transcriptional regulator [unclassified Pseudoclavibacter]PPF79571.1 MerR family transcriptional regulator [Pseudoclavibacter sp. RFBJ5]PPF88560.1 MerR family transcriptional regulator [Pseudoclavibacter sp. RFBJ3]PPG00428.1 MerR family transcriptional regulator [Pseudoclavibacter sp. RFBH5]PPG17342.1 MerR family transcriptional regulator [Pseudoclavibacter sp. RFBI4]
MRIGELADRTGVSTRALRYYEEQGLLHPERSSTGQRLFADDAVPRVQLIQQLFTAGLSSRLLVRLLPAIDDKHLDADLVHTLENERARMETQIRDLNAAHRRLETLITLSTRPHASTAYCPATLEEGSTTGIVRAA